MFKIHYSLRCDSLTSQLQLYSAMSFFLYNTLFNMVTNRNISIIMIILNKSYLWLCHRSNERPWNGFCSTAGKLGL